MLFTALGVAVWLAASTALAVDPVRAARNGPRRISVMFFGSPTQNGPHHDPITRYRVLKQAFGAEGIDLTYCEDPAVAFTPAMLERFDAVLMYANWRQNEPMRQRELVALLDWVKAGGGFVPVHCASACFGGSPLFVKLVGGRFESHGGEEFAPTNLQPEHPILAGLDPVAAWDETYVHSDHGSDREILQTRAGEPWSWTRRHGKGRVFYTASGHDHRVWDRTEFQQLLRNAIYWAVGPQVKQQLDALALPTLETEPVSLPGYRQRQEVTVAQKPLPPFESLKLAQVPHGMTLALFASEPDIVNPIHVAWDHRGRAFVVETIDYPNNLQAGNAGNDRITICEDTNRDGKADTFTRFAENLSIPTAIVFCRDGLLCTNGTELLYLADTDDDDRADVRQVVFDGFAMGDTHAGVSNLRYGIDGWIWATVGYSGFRGEVGGERHAFGQAVFRFRPDGSALEMLQNTTNNTWGLGFTEEFDVVGSTANANPSFYLTFARRRYDAAGMTQGRTPRADTNPVFYPSSTDIRQVDQFDRYTSAAGHAVYTARRLPAEYHNAVAFVCGPTGKLVGHFDLQRHGGGFRAVQSPNNFFCSADAWTSPVFADVGPDGAVWISDWYNIVVQHNPTPSKGSAGIDAKTGKGNAYETPLRDKQHGRIYRVFPTGSQNDESPALDPTNARSLLAGLAHDNMLWRLHAQRLLVEGLHVTAAPQLAQLVRESGPAAPHALQALAQLDRLDATTLAAALVSNHAALRRTAIRLANPDELKRAFVQGGDIAAEGRDLAEILAGISLAAADPAIGAAVFGVGARLGDALFDETALRDAWTMAARRQRASVIAAATAAGVQVGQDEEPENLLPNPGFEEVDGDVPAGWNDLRVYSGARGDAVELRSVESGRNGGRCLRIHAAERSDCGAAVRVTLEPGARYRLAGWIRTENLVPRPRTPGAMLNMHGGRAVTEGIVGTSDWTRVSAEFDAGSDDQGIIHCLFGGYGGATGTAYWDDVELTKIGGGATLAGALESLASEPADATSSTTPVDRIHRPDPKVHARGAEVYGRTCIACHGIDGKGVPQAFPPLDGSDWVTADPELSIKIVLHGLMGKITVGDSDYMSAMAPLGPTLDDRQIADVLTYVRQRWSNDAAPVSAAQVRAVRAATEDQTVMWTAAQLGR